MKTKTKPFGSEKEAKLFAKLVNGKLNKQHIKYNKYVYLIHYKSDGIYKGKTNNDIEINYDFNGYTHTYQDI
jgi:hypothetical protein